jgi:hypothetical protein
MNNIVSMSTLSYHRSLTAYVFIEEIVRFAGQANYLQGAFARSPLTRPMQSMLEDI